MQVQSQAMLVPALATLMGAMMGGGGGNLNEGIQNMTDFARKLIEEDHKKSKEGNKPEETEEYSHPMFKNYRANKALNEQKLIEAYSFPDAAYDV